MAQSTVGFMTHVTCRLTAKNLDQLWNSTLGDRVWASFTLFIPWFETEIVLERVFNWQFFSMSLFGPLILSQNRVG